MADTGIIRPRGADVDGLEARLASDDACLGIIGLGYVGLPLAAAAHAARFRVVGYDVDPDKIARLRSGDSPVGTVAGAVVQRMLEDGRFEATHDPQALASPDALIICVPTPLNAHRDPDLSFIVEAARLVRDVIRPGQLVVLESTTFPGTTVEVLKPILEESGLRAGQDFLLAYSPEREDPGNAQYGTTTIPRIVGADDARSRRAVETVYRRIVDKVVAVSDTRTAEAVKLTENIFRSVNIALVNELKLIFKKMGIDIWEVIEAAKTKPFGYMPFYPGPGLGGHCVPIDPFYLTWKAREYGVVTRFVELAGEINTEAPHHVVATLIDALSERSRKSLAGAAVLLLGLAYKKNVDDMRESPALRIFELLEARGALVDYFDPMIAVVPEIREHPRLVGRARIEWNRAVLSRFDAALICTDHDGVDYQMLVDAVPLVVDARNATRGVVANRQRIVLA